jgi:hypothetical protein
MRKGDFSIEVVANGNSKTRELESGHVLARPNATYCLRIRNHGPLNAVVAVDIDGRPMTAGGLVIRPWSATDLERPVGSADDGRFTVAAEGDENVFGEDGGRDNESLGLIVAEFRRELPRGNATQEWPPTIATPAGSPLNPPRPLPGTPVSPYRYPAAPPEWNPPRSPEPIRNSRLTPYQTRAFNTMSVPNATRESTPNIERAAGTGLTGHSSQQFEPAFLGPLEAEATKISLRIVIGSEEAIAAEPAPLLQNTDAPARPAARP